MDVTTRGDIADSMNIRRGDSTNGVMITGGKIQIVNAPVYDTLTWGTSRFEGFYTMADGRPAILGYGRDAVEMAEIPYNPNAPTTNWILLINDASGSAQMYIGPSGDLPISGGNTEVYELWYLYHSIAYPNWMNFHGIIPSSRTLYRGSSVEITTVPRIEASYSPVAAKFDPILLKDTETNVVWQIYAKDGRFFAKPVQE